MTEYRGKTVVTTTSCTNCCHTVHAEDLYCTDCTKKATIPNDIFIQNEKGENIPNPKYDSLRRKTNGD